MLLDCVCMAADVTLVQWHTSGESHTWDTSDVNMPSTILKVLQALSHHMRLGVVPDAAFQCRLLCLQHCWQARVRQALHYDALHESPAIIVLDEAHPLQARSPVTYQSQVLRIQNFNVNCYV